MLQIFENQIVKYFSGAGIRFFSFKFRFFANNLDFGQFLFFRLWKLYDIQSYNNDSLFSAEAKTAPLHHKRNLMLPKTILSSDKHFPRATKITPYAIHDSLLSQLM